MKVVIMAGGKGTRISTVVSDIPKPMINLEGKPILEHQIECVKSQGYKDITIITGHLGNKIHEYFGDGEKWDINLTYFDEQEPLGTVGALAYLKEELTDDFILLNGDIVFDINFDRLVKYHKENSAIATIVTHPNSHPYDSALVVTNEKGRVTRWLHKEEKRGLYKNRVNAGIHILNPVLLKNITAGKKTDLDREILKPLIEENGLYAYDTPEYIMDMGTPERYCEVIGDYKKGKIHAKNLFEKQRAIFLDRDGTVNVYKGFIRKNQDLELLPKVSEAIKKINQAGYLCIIVTNQPVIARGECSFEELDNIHMKLETELGKEGAYIDALYYCPHHPDKGFEGERPEYKMECECRKPKAGMLLEAAKFYNIDLQKSYMIGDSENDILAGKNAGVSTVYLENELNNKYDADKVYASLYDFVEKGMEKIYE